MAYLANSPLNLTSLREHSRRELEAVLDEVKGRKALFIDKPFSGPLVRPCC